MDGPHDFDIHGQAKYPDSILRGTQHGSTVQSLLARSGAEAVTGANSVFGQFAAMGYTIAPPNELPPTARVETQGYTGGHIVVTYGSNRPDGIDAIQLIGQILPEQCDFPAIVARPERDARVDEWLQSRSFMFFVIVACLTLATVAAATSLWA